MASIETNSSILFMTYTASVQAKTMNDNKVTNFNSGNELRLFGAEINTFTHQNIGDQNALFHFNRLSDADKAGLTYGDRPISELSVEEARDLVGADGYFGIDKTSQRIADFVLKGAGDDIQRLRTGREGILKGFEAAEKAWGGKLPEISYDTLAKTLETIDEKIGDLGESVVDLTA